MKKKHPTVCKIIEEVIEDCTMWRLDTRSVRRQVPSGEGWCLAWCGKRSLM